MMIFTRFECPRCQHVFIKDGADDAFADCPKCQSMALAIGEATSAEPQAVPQLSSDEGAPVPEQDSDATVAGALPPLQPETDAPSGVFSGLLEESDDGFVPDVTHDDMRVPATLEEMQQKQQAEEDDPFDEATRQVDELPASLLLTRGENDAPAPAIADGGGDDFDPFSGLELPGGGEEEDIHLAPTDVLRPQGSEETAVAPNPLATEALDDESAWENGPPTGVPTAGADPDESAWENGPPTGVPIAAGDEPDEDAWENGPPPSALPTPPPSPEQSGGFVRPAAFAITRDDEEPVQSQPSGGGAPAPFDSGFFEAADAGKAPASAPLASDDFNAGGGEAPAPVSADGGQQAWDPNFQQGAQDPAGQGGAMMLDDIEGQMNGSVQFQDPDSVGLADAFSQLEAAFDTAAAAPDPTPQPPQDDHGGMDQDPAFQMAQAALAQQSSTPSVPAPPSADEPPPMRRARQRGHLTLSEEAKALAGIPIQPEAGSHNLALELTRGAPEQPPPRRPAPVSTPGLAPAGVALEPPISADEAPEVTDPVTRPTRAQGTAAPEEEERERTFRGFTPLRIILAVLVFLVVGTGVGAVTAPAPEKKPVTARDRAEEKFARGNRFYEEQRFDDALGEYRGALSLDPTLAPAHRAKAAVLAKLQRHEEAARAYYKYLEVAPSAVDAGEVREVLARWEGKTDS